ncbi:MAG TPA: NAD(P)/FAD-dependent oxidoreductase [bacterium]
MIAKPETFDVIVVGAGPAGSSAAAAAATEGVSVLLLEEHETVGVPLQCAEGLSRSTINGYLDIKPDWTAAELKGSVARGPDGDEFTIEYPKVGWVMNRKVFDPALAKIARDRGVVLKTRAKVIGLDAGKVIIKEGDSKKKYGYRFLIAADGISSKVGQWLGIDTRLSLAEIEVCAQYKMENIKVKAGYTHLIFGRSYAPGGYAWIFPTSANSANIGLGISPLQTKVSARDLLDAWIRREFPHGVIKERIFGGVPAKVLKRFSGNDFFLIGDAARFTDPLSGAGIANGIKSGVIAGVSAASRLRGKKDTFEKDIKREIMKEVSFHKKVREAYFKLSDEDYVKIFKVGRKIFSGKTITDINTRKMVGEILLALPHLMRLGIKIVF